uniref:Uncharacterized protein n=1 Tax=Arion vulgaris TaxID=1028688 RepID=A0A0B7AZV5_9EUPU
MEGCGEEHIFKNELVMKKIITLADEREAIVAVINVVYIEYVLENKLTLFLWNIFSDRRGSQVDPALFG